MLCHMQSVNCIGLPQNTTAMKKFQKRIFDDCYLILVVMFMGVELSK